MKVKIPKLKIEVSYPCGCYLGFDKELSPTFLFVPCGRAEHNTQGNCHQLIDAMKRELAVTLEFVPIPKVDDLMK